MLDALPSVHPEPRTDGDTISRQDAIECLEHLSACDEPFVEIGTDDETFIRKYEAITEISELPPVQPEPCDDAVSRADVVDMLEMYPFTEYGKYETAREVVKRLPPVQPEIIRCKDCKYNATSKKCLNPNSFFLVPADDDYCSYAERRTDE